MRAEFYSTRRMSPVHVQLDHYATDAAALEAIFSAFNGYPPAGDHDLAADAARYDGPSMSVGDVVVLIRPCLDGDLRLPYACKRVGWERCTEVRGGQVTSAPVDAP